MMFYFGTECLALFYSCGSDLEKDGKNNKIYGVQDRNSGFKVVRPGQWFGLCPAVMQPLHLFPTVGAAQCSKPFGPGHATPKAHPEPKAGDVFNGSLWGQVAFQNGLQHCTAG